MDNDEAEQQDCAVCLRNCLHPTQLPCGHIFCFLCVKGVAIINKKCALCRSAIPSDYLDHPEVLESATRQADEAYKWYYEGRSALTNNNIPNQPGWWEYEERNNIELETAYQAGDAQCKLLIAGTLYCVDFDKMLQYQSRNHRRRRRVKRDAPLAPAKGIAGIKIETPQDTVASNESESEENQDTTPPPVNNDAITQTNALQPTDSIETISQRMRAMNLLRSFLRNDPSDGDT